MPRMATMIWFWSLVILPFTTMLTFIITLVVCSKILHYPRAGGKLPQISLLAVDSAYPYFVSGFVILFEQIILIFLGRLQYLCQSQSIVHRVFLFLIHVTGVMSGIFLLIMAIANINNHSRLHVIGVFGMFGYLSAYCFLDTIVIIYLFIKRSEAPQHSNILWPLWFLVCSILLTIFSSVWGAKQQTILQYLAVAIPFLYILGFVPQFWTQAKMKRRDPVVSSSVYY